MWFFCVWKASSSPDLTAPAPSAIPRRTCSLDPSPASLLFASHLERINSWKPSGALGGTPVGFKPRTEHSHPCTKKTSSTQMVHVQVDPLNYRERVGTWCSPHRCASLQRWRALLGGADCWPKGPIALCARCPVHGEPRSTAGGSRPPAVPRRRKEQCLKPRLVRLF